MGVYIWNKLPSEYQEVEYIQSDTSNVQYINTGYLPTSNPKIELDFMYINGVETTDYVWFDIYGRRGSTNSTYIGMYINNPNGYVSPNYAGFDPAQNSGVTISKNTRYYHIQDRGQFYLNGTKYANASTTNTLATANYPVFLFGNNIQGTVQGRVKSMRVYSCKMWNDGTLVRDFIPCYRKSDSVVGLYDLVNNQFYTNSGTGTFTKGSDVNTYRESSLKNAYIGEYKGFEYSYDFRGKTSSQVISDGWSYGDYTTGIGCDSDGLYGTSNGSRLIMYTDFDMSNVSKITLEDQVKTQTDYDLNFGLCSSIQRTNGTYIYQCGYYNDGVAAGGLELATPKWDDYNGTYAWKYVIDLDAKTYSVTRTTGGLTGYSGSITDTMVSNIRNNPMYLMVLSANKTGCRMQKVSALIE